MSSTELGTSLTTNTVSSPTEAASNTESERGSAGVPAKVEKTVAVIRVLIAVFALVAAGAISLYWSSQQPEAMANWSIYFSFAIMLWALLACTKHSVLLAFELGYFIFIYGRVFAVQFLGAKNLPYGHKGGEIGLAGTYGTDPGHVVNSFGLYFIFNVVLIISYCVVFYGASYWRTKKLSTQEVAKTPRYAQPVAQKAIKYAFYISVPFAFINAWYAISYVWANGYFAYAQVRNQVTPAIFSYGAEFSLVAFFAFLATMPRMRELFFPLVLFFLTRSVLILTGNRNSVMLPLLAVVIYLLARGINWKAIRQHPFVSAGLATVVAVFAVVGINSISRVNEARGTQVQGGDAVPAALVELGVTGNLPILLTEKGYLEQIPEGRAYAFGPFITFFQSRILGPIYGDGRFDYLQGASAEQALHGHSFAHTFSYYYMGDSYLGGAGFGSSAPVELWVDAGLLGVAIGALVYGILFVVLQRSLTRPFWPSLISVLIVQRIPWTPRASYSEPFLSFNVRVLVGLVALVILLEAVLYAQKKWSESKAPVEVEPSAEELRDISDENVEIEDRQGTEELVAAGKLDTAVPVLEPEVPEQTVEPEPTADLPESLVDSEPTVESEPAVESEPTEEFESVLLGNPAAIPALLPEPEPEPDFVPVPEPEPEYEPESDVTVEPEPEPVPEPEAVEEPALVAVEEEDRQAEQLRDTEPVRIEEPILAGEPSRIGEPVHAVEPAAKSSLSMKLTALGESLIQLVVAYALTLLGKVLRKIVTTLVDKLTGR